jgi:hypothetical protein
MLSVLVQGSKFKGEQPMTQEQENQENVVHEIGGTPRWVGFAVWVLAAISVAGLGFGWNASIRAKNTEQHLESQTETLRTLNQDVGILSKRLSQAEEANAQVRGELTVVTDRLKLTQGEERRAHKQAKQIQEAYAKQLEEFDSSVKSELATKARADDLKSLSGDVSGVRTDLDATKQSLQMARGELGTLIAKNHDEIELLRRMGQRDYFEFSLEKKGSKQRVSEVSLELRGTNTKRNQFTIALYADDMRLEKKNRSVNEPIYFYIRAYRAPLELVVNKVAKNKVVGYVSVPKNTAVSSSGN